MGNSARDYSGLRISGPLSTFQVNNSRFLSNTSTMFAAGAGFSASSSGEVRHCLFANNLAALSEDTYYNSGGASVWSNASVDFINCTFVDNHADYGAGLTVGGGGNASLRNSILWGNSVNQIALAVWNSSGGTLLVNYSDVLGGIDSVNVSDSLSSLLWGDNNLDTDPLFCNPDSNEYTVAENSPCVGAGENGVTMGVLGVGCPVMAVDHSEELLPEQFALYQNYPNPFNPNTTIRYDLPERSSVSLVIYDLLGHHVRTLVSQVEEAGYKSVTWDGKNHQGRPLGTSVYLCRITAGEYIKNNKMILLKVSMVSIKSCEPDIQGG